MHLGKNPPAVPCGAGLLMAALLPQALEGVNMKLLCMRFHLLCLAGLLPGASLAQANAGAAMVYRCPGPPVLYTDAITPSEARDRGCRTIEGAPITVVQAAKPRPAPAAGSAAPTGRPAGTESRIDPSAQRARDADAKRILESELAREEERLTALKKDFNNGEPERRGDERNAQKYIERVAEMKAAIARREADIAALKRELLKQP